MPSQPSKPNAAHADPEFQELVDYFLTVLPERVAQLEDAASRSDAAALRTFAHQLKGAAPGFGFDDIGRLAGHLEKGLDRNAADVRAIDNCRSEIEGLVALCRSYFRAA